MKEKMKVSIAAEKMVEAFSSNTLMQSLAWCESRGIDLREQSELYPEEIASVLVGMFGETVMKNIPSVNLLCAYMDLDMIGDLRRTIFLLQHGCDSRIQTIHTLINTGEYFAFLALKLNSGIFCRRTAFEILSASVMLYELCQRILPYVFGDIEFCNVQHVCA